MMNLFGSEDKKKERKVKIPMDFEDDALQYESSKNVDFGVPKKAIKVVKTKSNGIKKKNNNKNDLF